MKKAKFVIFSGGHATCFETIKYAKPSICIPTQPEQLGNAAKLQDLNCSITVKNKKQLEKAVQKMVSKKESYNKNIAKLNEFSNRFKGLDRAVSIVEGLSD
jgi:UDP:flavonoid glycosyltransferase YjiC (YdhE family)